VNPRTAAYAGRRTGAPVHHDSLRALAVSGPRYHAITFTDVLEHMPDPRAVLEASRALLVRGGWIAVKVPYGDRQLVKERIRARLRGRRPSIGTNLVHVSHFSPRSLRLGLSMAGFDSIAVSVGAPELFCAAPRGTLRVPAANAVRLACYRLARALPLGVRSPLAFNLQAFARRGD
jgi:Methyltransferase domain